MGGDEMIGGHTGAVTTSWARLQQLYWRVTLVLIPSMIPALYFGAWALRLAVVTFGLSLVILFLLRHRIPRAAILIHVGINYFTALAQLVLPATAVITVLTPSEWRPALTIFATVGIFALGVYGGPIIASIALGASLAVLSSHLIPNIPTLIALALGAAAGTAIRVVIAELIRSHDQWSRHAMTDPLTGLGNRRAMEQGYLAFQTTARKRGLTMFLSLWDLDNLKQINDTHGHVQGDDTLLAFADVLRGALKKEDSVYRIGGDEFCCLHLGLQDGASIIDRVRQVSPAVSVGLVECHNLPLGDALQQVDKLMYEDKRRRRGGLGGCLPPPA